MNREVSEFALAVCRSSMGFFIELIGRINAHGDILLMNLKESMNETLIATMESATKNICNLDNEYLENFLAVVDSFIQRHIHAIQNRERFLESFVHFTMALVTKID